MSDEQFDLIVIGGGPGGESCAAAAARAGARVAVIERELVGGECPYWGCMPAKALLRPPQALREARRIPGAAELVADGPVDIPAALARRDEVIGHLEDDRHADRLERRDVTIIRGSGALAGERRVRVSQADGSDVTLEAARAVVLAPGSRAAFPPIDGLEAARPWTNREATTTETIPRRLAVIGGGVIGVELSQAFASLGSTVTILEAADRILEREEPEGAELVAQGLREAGVTIRVGCRITRVERRGDGGVDVTIGGETVEFDELLVATGRIANTEHLGLQALGIEPGRGGFIEVCDCMHHVDHPWLFVIGDANGRAQFTHTAVYQGKVAARNALGLETHCVEDEVAAPRVVFTEPNLCAVGHTKESARKAGLVVDAYDRDPQLVAGGSFYGKGTTGFATILVERETRLVVGATFVGSDLAELLHSATIAIVGRVPIERLRHCVAPFPTRSEVWTRLISQVDADEERRAAAAPT